VQNSREAAAGNSLGRKPQDEQPIPARAPRSGGRSFRFYVTSRQNLLVKNVLLIEINAMPPQQQQILITKRLLLMVLSLACDVLLDRF